MSQEFLKFSELSREARLNLAKALLDAPAVDTDTNIKILTSTPPAQKSPDAINLAIGVADAQNTYLTIKDLTDEALGKRFCRISGTESEVTPDELIDALIEIDNPKNISGFFDLVENEIIKPNSGTNEMLAAMSHYALVIAQRFYKECESPETKMRARTFVVYYAAIETLSLGVETNAKLQALYPEADNLSLEKGPIYTVVVSTKEELNKCALKEIFSGGKATPVGDLGGRFITTIIPGHDDRQENP